MGHWKFQIGDCYCIYRACELFFVAITLILYCFLCEYKHWTIVQLNVPASWYSKDSKEMCCMVSKCVAMYFDVLRMTGIKSSSWEGWKGSWLASERGLAPFQPSSVFLPGLRNILTSSAKYLYKSWEIFQLHRLLKRSWLAKVRSCLMSSVCVAPYWGNAWGITAHENHWMGQIWKASFCAKGFQQLF